jgi:hypothetical protein
MVDHCAFLEPSQNTHSQPITRDTRRVRC